MQEEQLPENVTSSMTEAMSGGGGIFEVGFYQLEWEGCIIVQSAQVQRPLECAKGELHGFKVALHTFRGKGRGEHFMISKIIYYKVTNN